MQYDMKQSVNWMLGILLVLVLALTIAGCGNDENEADTDGDIDSESDDDSDGDSDDDAEDLLAPHLETQGLYTIAYLRGTPYEMGQQHGELFHDVIADAMEFVDNDPILSNIPVLAEGMGLITVAEENSYQDLLDECEGIVDTAGDTGFTMEFCLILNFGDVLLEFLSSGIPDEEAVKGPGCTQVFTSGDATPDGRLYHARNLDWGSFNIDIIHQNPVIFVRQPDDGIPHVFVGFPLNMSPYTGMNVAGISACSNEIDPLDNSVQSATGRSHVQMMAKILKTAESFDEAQTFLEGEPHMSSEIIALADGETGQAGVFEMTGKYMAVRMIENGLIYAVNHFMHPDMVDYDLPQDDANPDSSIMRSERLEQLVEPDGQDSLYGQLDLNGLITVMRDRVNPRTGVEAGPEEIDNDAGLATNGPMHMVVFDPEKLLFWVAAGHVPIPSEPYTCFSLTELLHQPDAIPCDPEIVE